MARTAGLSSAPTPERADEPPYPCETPAFEPLTPRRRVAKSANDGLPGGPSSPLDLAPARAR